MNAIKFLVNIFFAICFMNLLLFKANASDNLSLNLNHESPEEHEHSNSFDEENRVKYVGAVLEYEPFNKWSEEGKGFEVLRKNSRTIVKFAEKAKFYNADIIIAPECGVQSFYMFHNNTENFLTFTQYVPDPSLRMVVCDQEEEPDNKYEAIKILSCGSLANEIYIVANLAEFEPCSEEKIDQTLPWRYEIQENCPKKGYFIYNTQVVFDRKGAVIARYRKQNLYHEPLFTPGSNNSEAIFITDFNVAFTLQICFDIVHWNPGFANVKKYGIRDVAMSTAWFDTLPFYLANGVENGFSRGLGVNLLVSGYHRPEEGNLGSGIFKGYAMDNTSLYSFDENFRERVTSSVCGYSSSFEFTFTTNSSRERRKSP
ncbi:Vanin-like protein 2 [Armadillidium nasatum]|uniref:Vanin-like protein 2 n=1 Tax=Armadillidium nasatum TaxID=96803 RepID=A0A5N5T433_9CRUS|nr:Vanin-like protein 2 [Armadillidium nasatum]